MKAALDVHNRVIRAEIERSGGYEVKTIGDAFMVAFDRAADAVAFAVAAQAGLADAEWPAEPLTCRMGVHAGPVVAQPGPRGHMDYFGPVVNMAARVEAAAHGHQVIVSGAARAGDFDWTDLGEHVLKGIEGRHRLWQVGPGEFPRPRTVGIRRTNLPARPDSFIGRAAEVAEVRQLLESGARLVTLLGPGGAGKTRLSQKLGSEMLGDAFEAVWFCDLSEARSRDSILFAVARALDVPLGKEPVRQLGWALEGRGRVLIVLDNFEQVVEHAATTLGVWVGMAPEMAFLVTSRIPVRLRGERSVEVGPMPVTEDGIALLADRGHGVDPADPAARDLVEMLDGLPLAIELAAARTRSMSVQQIADRMDQRFKLLAGGASDLPDRHRALSASLDWSWDLLTDDERSAMAQASVFEGGFTLEAAEAVLQIDGWVPDVLGELVAHSLARREPETGRYGMMASVQAYSAARAHAERDTHVRHGEYFADWSDPVAARELEGDERLEYHRRLRDDLDNLVAACRRAIDRRDPRVALATACAAWVVFAGSGPASGHALLEATRALITDPALAPEADRVLGLACRSVGRVDEAWERIEAAVAGYRAVGDRWGEGVALSNYAALHSARPESREQAPGLFEEALAIHRAVGNRVYEANVLADLALYAMNRGDADRALDQFGQALELHRAVGNLHSEANVLSNMGVLWRDRSEPDRAIEAWERALSVSRRGGWVATGALTNLGLLYGDQGRIDAAVAALEEAVRENRRTGQLRDEGISTGNLGNLLRSTTECGTPARDEARRHLERALALHRELGFAYGLPYRLYGLALLDADDGDLDRALARAEEAVELGRPYNSTYAEALSALVRVHLARGDIPAARETSDRARAQAVEGPVGIRVALAEARTCRAEGRIDAARAAASQAKGWMDQLGIGAESAFGRELSRCDV